MRDVPARPDQVQNGETGQGHRGHHDPPGLRHRRVLQRSQGHAQRQEASGESVQSALVNISYDFKHTHRG